MSKSEGENNLNSPSFVNFQNYIEDRFSETENENEAPEYSGTEESLPWDAFKYFPAKNESESMKNKKWMDVSMRVIKVFVYGIIFCVVLCSSLVTKITVLFAVSQLDEDKSVQLCNLYSDFDETIVVKNTKSSRVTWICYTICMFLVPEFINVLHAIWYFVLKKKQKMLKKRSIVMLCFLETLHPIGLALLVFYCLPQLNSVDAAAICSCIYFIPALLNLLSQNRRNNIRIMIFILILLCNILALLAQASGVYVHSFLQDNGHISIRYILPIALLLCSCRWWSNYVSPHSYFGFMKYLATIKEDLINKYYVLQGCVALWRSLLFILSAITISTYKGIQANEFFELAWHGKYYAEYIKNPNSTYSTSEQKEIHTLTPFYIFLVQVFCAFLTYTVAKFAYKTHMHKFGFTVPINLTTLGTILIITVLCIRRKQDLCAFYNFIPDYLFFNEPSYDNINNFILSWRIWCWIIWWLSQIWITIHLWFDENDILAPVEQIFYNATYDSLMIDQFLALNKRKNENYNMIEEEHSNFTSDFKINHTVEVPNLDIPHPILLTKDKNNKTNVCVTQIYVCATMWHEIKEEMHQLIGSILRLDKDQCAIKVTQKYYNIFIEDYYELETHIFFDDAFCCMHDCSGPCNHNENEVQINQYVRTFLETMKESVEALGICATPPTKYPTPYGGQLVWTLPGKTRLTVHLKDKNKIRHRKRWSQVMYMYYLLGYRLMDTSMDDELKEQIADNTYILTLDGDIDFRPTAVKVLLDLMKKDKELGAACGRIHPVGEGTMIWFQKFEYAIGHWLQKSTEHVLGSVLCSPGCFSLFRAKALMQHNVIAKYATKSTEPRHYIQYDQGEDRWLCTLILQIGYKVEYCAAGDAYTRAPETFKEFYIQRKRWISSTIANLFDLLGTSKETRKINNNISWIYVTYQWILTGSTVIGPGTIFLMMVGAFVATFHIDNWTSFWYNLIPIASFVVVCFFCQERIQLITAQIITVIYGIVMMVVLVGIILQIVSDGSYAPNTLLFFIIICQFILTAFFHPRECSCLLFGGIYYVTVPSMYMILIMFSLFNVHNVTWGTRESKVQISQSEQKKQKTENKWMKFSLNNLVNYASPSRVSPTDKNSEKEMEFLNSIYKSLNEINNRLEQIESNYITNNTTKDIESDTKEMITENNKANEQTELQIIEDDTYNSTSSESETSIQPIYSHPEYSNYLINPYWLQDEHMKNGRIDFLSTSDEDFWKQLIQKYLHPIENDVEKQREITEGLLSIRNECVSKFFVLNTLFVMAIFLLQLNKDSLHLPWPFAIRYNITYTASTNDIHVNKEFMSLEPIGCLFILSFIVILLIQFLAMLVHRFNTFSHILANVKLNPPCCGKEKYLLENLLTSKHIANIAEELQNAIENEMEFTLRNNIIRASGKRKTIRELVEDAQSHRNLSTNYEILFHRKLRESVTLGEDMAKIAFSSVPRSTMKALDNRHSKILTEYRNLQPQNNIHNETENVQPSSASSRKKNENAKVYEYDNPTFLNDNDD